MVFLIISVTFFNDKSDIASLRIDGNSDWWIKLLKLQWRKSVKISAFSLIILDGISESWQAFDASKFKISFKISSVSTHLKEK